MAIREKINSYTLGGVVTVAAVIGVMTQSWGLFLFTGLILYGMAIQSGMFRAHGRDARRG